jgi:hypothetical protein
VILRTGVGDVRYSSGPSIKPAFLARTVAVRLVGQSEGQDLASVNGSFA